MAKEKTQATMKNVIGKNKLDNGIVCNFVKNHRQRRGKSILDFFQRERDNKASKPFGKPKRQHVGVSPYRSKMEIFRSGTVLQHYRG